MALDEDARKRLSKLVHKERIAHLGTLRNGAPMVSMTLFVPESDFSAFYIHVSRLAWHTQDMLQDPRVALSIAQTDDGRPNPFMLARLTIRGEAVEIPIAQVPVPPGQQIDQLALERVRVLVFIDEQVIET